MNQQIKDLAIKAGNESDFEIELVTDAFLEKFAELIVRECACLVLNGKYDGEKFNPTDEFHQGWNKALDAVAMGIKQQYFGAEE